MEEKKQVTIPAICLATVLLIGVAIGVLLLVIGAATETNGAIYASLIITPLALLSGGFLLKEESNTNGFMKLRLKDVLVQIQHVKQIHYALD